MMYYPGFTDMRKSTIIEGMTFTLGLSWDYGPQYECINIISNDNEVISKPHNEQDAIIFLSGYRAAVERAKTLKQIVRDSRIKTETTRGVSATSSKLIKALGRFF